MQVEQIYFSAVSFVVAVYGFAIGVRFSNSLILAIIYGFSPRLASLLFFVMPPSGFGYVPFGYSNTDFFSQLLLGFVLFCYFRNRLSFPLVGFVLNGFVALGLGGCQVMALGMTPQLVSIIGSVIYSGGLVGLASLGPSMLSLAVNAFHGTIFLAVISSGYAAPLSWFMSLVYLFASDLFIDLYATDYLVQTIFIFYSGRWIAYGTASMAVLLSNFFPVAVAQAISRWVVKLGIPFYIIVSLVLHIAFLQMFLVLLGTLSFSMVLATALVFMPVIIVLNIGLLFEFSTLLYMLITMDWSLANHFNVYVAIYWKFGVGVLAGSRAIVEFFWNGLNPIVRTVQLMRFLVRLPAELWFMMVENESVNWTNIKPVRHLKLKVSIAIFVFSSYLLNLIFFLKLVVWAFAFISALAVLILGFFHVHSPAHFFATFILLSVSNLMAVFPNWYSVFTTSLRRQAVEVAFIGYILTNPGITFDFHHSEDGDVSIGVRHGDLDDETINAVFDMMFPAIGTFVLFAWIFFVVLIIRASFNLTLRVSKTLILFPVRIFEAFLLAMIVFFLPDSLFDTISAAVVIIFSFLEFRTIREAISLFLKQLRYGVLASVLNTEEIDPNNPYSVKFEQRGGAGRLSQIFTQSWLNMGRRSVLRFIERLDEVRLPEMIQAAYRPPTLESIRNTYRLLEELQFSTLPGFADSLKDEDTSNYLAEWGSWRNWRLGSSNFVKGFPKVRVALNSWLPSFSFFPDVAGYIHTSTFTGVEEELRATARYWTGNDTNDTEMEMDEMLDGLWEGVKSQFANSQLTAPEAILKAWEKKFNFGFGFGYFTAKGHMKQKTRAQVIQEFGGVKAFGKVWRQVFKIAQLMDLPSPVFTKMESLKIKKAISRSVRTVVGSDFGEYVMATVFNYGPNHNYDIWRTPAKVGMPINGMNFDTLWTSLLTRTSIWAGDMSLFDSSQPPVAVRLCAALRKKGFEAHSDYDKICQLVDITYEKLIRKPMGFKNFGELAFKGQGMTTGHSSTSADNSLLLLINYLFAWRMVTGMRCREFYNFNTLANLGDDHVLGYDPVFGWSPQAAIEAMSKLGTVMRDEAPGVERLPNVNDPPPPGGWRFGKFSFLAKVPLPMTPEIKAELLAAGIDKPLNFATCHDPLRLIGKIKGQVEARKLQSTLRSYQVILAYIDLTPHHKDIYDQLMRAASQFYNEHAPAWRREGVSEKRWPKPPSYNAVLRKWYAKDVNVDPFARDDSLDEEFTEQIVMMSNPDLLSFFVRWLSDFPTMLSPRYTNLRWADWLQMKLADRLSWPLTLVAHANQVVSDPIAAKSLLQRTPYQFLRNENINLTSSSYGVCLTRHLLFMGFSRFFVRSRTFSILDFFRLFDSFFANFLFFLTGRVTTVVVELDLHIVETIVVFLLSYVYIDLNLQPILTIIPSPSTAFARFFTFALSTIMPSGSIDFQSYQAAVRLMLTDPRNSFVLAAPTGVGKSTRMMRRLANECSETVIVICPRRLVAESVGAYMKMTYPGEAIGVQTEGVKAPRSTKLLYTTAQSYLMSPYWRTIKHILVIDEAHVDEPITHTIIQYSKLTFQRTIYVTATPTIALQGIKLVNIPAVSQFSVTETKLTTDNIASYCKNAASFISSRATGEKILVFVPRIRDAYRVRELCSRPTCILSSNNKTIDPNVNVYISTSVGDAGITIPDVSFVLSPNVGISVSYDDVDENFGKEYRGPGYVLAGSVAPSVSFFRLPDATLKQRRGRTGRTGNGTFILYDLILEPVVPLVHSVSDYIRAITPNAKGLCPFLPPSILAQVSDDLKEVLVLTDLAETFSWTSFMNIIRKFRHEAEETGIDDLETWVEMDDTQRHYEEIGKLHFGRELDPDVVELPFTGWAPTTGGPDIYAGDVPESDDEWQPPAPPSGKPRRIDVSGQGLLCGARAVRGILWTTRGLAPSVATLQRDLINFQPGHQPIQHNYFASSLLTDFLYRVFGVATDLYLNGVRTPTPTAYAGGVTATLFLDNEGFMGHYQYFGLAAPRREDDTPYEEWKLNMPLFESSDPAVRF